MVCRREMSRATSACCVALLCALCIQSASASWLNATALANRINATLAAKGSPLQSPVVSKAQSAYAGKTAGANLAESYLIGNRTLTFNPKNATSLAGFVDYTRGRLAFEAQLKSGSAFTTAAVKASSASAASSNIVCYVDPQAGTVLNVIQGKLGSCTAGGTPVTIPTAGKFVTRIEMAIDKELPLVGRFNFFVQDTLDSKATVYTCGYAGGEAISLFPKGYVVSSLPIGCQPLTPAAMGRRRLAATTVPKLAVNPQLVNPVVASAAEVAAAVASGVVSGAVSPAVDPTGVVQASTFSVPAGSLSTGAVQTLATANSFPTPPVQTPFTNGTNSG